MAPTLELTEGRFLDSITLPRSVAAALTTEGIATVVPQQAEDVYSVGNVRKVGALVIDGVVLRIQPKTPVSRLFALLSYARAPDALWRNEAITFHEDDDLYSAIASAFTQALTRATAGGLLHGYVLREEALPVVRGRWRVVDQITRRAGQQLPLEVSYDDYADDIPENQVLRAAADRLLRFPGLAPAVAGALRRARRPFEGVSVLPRGIGCPSIRIDRRNQGYRNVLALARLILTDASLEHRVGSVVGTGFLVDTWTVFEDFVGTALSLALEKRSGRVTKQLTSSLDVERRASIAPDLLWQRDGVVTACVDLKYKVEKNGSYPNADLYQLIAYCTRFGLARGHLIYAAGDLKPQIVRVINGPTVVQHALDLSAPFADLLGQVDAVAEQIAGDV